MQSWEKGCGKGLFNSCFAFLTTIYISFVHELWIRHGDNHTKSMGQTEQSRAESSTNSSWRNWLFRKKIFEKKIHFNSLLLLFFGWSELRYCIAGCRHFVWISMFLLATLMAWVVNLIGRDGIHFCQSTAKLQVFGSANEPIFVFHSVQKMKFNWKD